MVSHEPEESSGKFLCGVVEGFYGRPWTTGQRKELFRRLRRIGLNAYMYAPKDDIKHRANWRDMYSVEEAEHLTGLIQAAHENKVEFFYALSPGLDIVFSSQKEVACMKKKLDQVSEFGCRAFALLFDDIEAEMCASDKEIFKSFAHAQVSVTNEVYQHLGQPHFLFCPTEYCSSRAVPDVRNSEYLNTLGSKLLPDIDVLWTGTKVISKTINVQSVEEVNEVIKRPPLIWDNIHANDYDQKRLFLGPYEGRSTDCIPLIRGVLTNPNCEFEANFIAMHTLAQWAKCKCDKKDEISDDAKLETEGNEEDLTSLDPSIYSAKRALQNAVSAWLAEFYTPLCIPGSMHGPSSSLEPSPILPMSISCSPSRPSKAQPPQQTINTCLNITTTTVSTASANTSKDTLKTVIANEVPLPCIELSLPAVAKETASTGCQQQQPLPMHTLINSLTSDPAGPDPYQNDGGDEPMEVLEGAKGESAAAAEGTGSAAAEDLSAEEKMQTTEPDLQPATTAAGAVAGDHLTIKDVLLLVDLFYLPYEHGQRAVHILQEFHWLKSRSELVRPGSRSTQDEVKEWRERAESFSQSCKAVSTMFTRLANIPNRPLLYDLYQYVWDMRGVISLLSTFVKWLGCSRGYRETFISGDQEPWIFRGGLAAEFQRMLPLDGASDLFSHQPPDCVSNKIFTIRPYFASDEASVYKVCTSTSPHARDLLDSHPDLIGDKVVGGFLTLSPEYCFVVEDEDGICGFVVAALTVDDYYKKLEIAWLPELRTKYPLPVVESDNPTSKIVESFHKSKIRNFAPNLYSEYPSVVQLCLLSTVTDNSLPKRMMTCALSALKSNGSSGVHHEVSLDDKHSIDFYKRLGFYEPRLAEDCISNNMLFLARHI